MVGPSSGVHGEGLRAARLLMVLGSMSPVFILWAIRGSAVIADRWFIGFCVLMVVIPNAFLFLRIYMARKRVDRRTLVVGGAEDHRDHMLVYLFAMLLPLYGDQLTSWRDLGATAAALTFIVFLFWHLNLHYMNLVFAAFGYRIFTISPPDENPLSGITRQVVITQRVNLARGSRIIAYRVSDTVYLAEENEREP